ASEAGSRTRSASLVVVGAALGRGLRRWHPNEAVLVTLLHHVVEAALGVLLG
ncbi:hypothetical protein SPRG_05374, partial [Saprolegnia parasitica CBS 223.65]